MATRRAGPGCCHRVLLPVLLSVAGLGGAVGCCQMSGRLAPADRTWSNVSPGESQFSTPEQSASAGMPAPDRPMVRAQTPSGPIMPEWELPPSPVGPPEQDGLSQSQVVDVRVVGARRTPVEEVLRHIRTRPGRPYDLQLIQDDVRRLFAMKKFVDVNARHQEVPGGKIVFFEVLERPVLKYVKYVGCQDVGKNRLEKESGIKAGDAMDPFAVEEGRRRLEDFYRSKGYNKVQITIVEGSQASDLGAIYLINEGPKQRIGWTRFIGNTVASDARLRTKIQSKPGIFWIFKGELGRRQIEQDVQQLTDYYRSLGYFRAEISRLPVDPTKDWQLLTFVIHEGPRYVVRDVSFVGNRKFSSEELAQELKLKPGDFFNQAEMQRDRHAVTDRYGAVGHVSADVNVKLKFDPEPGPLDLVYDIQEGECYRVGRIVPNILGDNPHTQVTTILDRMSLYPGDIIDIRELRASERRLKASGLFEYDPMRGIAPQIVVRLPDLEDMETGIAREPDGQPRYRGQSPDGVPRVAYRPPDTADAPSGERVVDLHVKGQWISDPPPAPQPPARGPQGGQSPVGPNWRSSSDSGMIVRGQYSPDAGLSVPALPRAEPRPLAQPQPPYGHYLPPPGTAPPPVYPVPFDPATAPFNPPPAGPAYPDSTYPQPDASATYDQAAPAPGFQGGTLGPPPASAPVGPVYGSQFGAPFATGPPGGPQPSGVFAPDATDIDPGSIFFGNPPSQDPFLHAPLYPEVYETRTGRLMFSLGVNSEAGVMGSMILEEQNFDWKRFPTSLEDIRSGIAWRGGGERFRLEAVPGSEVQRYAASFQKPYLYLFDRPFSLSLSGFFFNRWYREWDEERLGGRVGLGYQFTHDLSGTLSFRGEKIQIYDPVEPTPPELTEVLGSNALYGFRGQLVHDTRDNRFLATEGHYFEIGVEQVIGSFTYTRGDLDLRRYFLLREHPDGSGRHVLSLAFRGAVSSDDTPIYEHYYAGGFSTIRGFDFRGASPRDANGVPLGGHFMMLASVEYMFPLTADDNLRAVVFCDSGTVEPTIDNWTDKYRVAPGVGLRIVIPAMGPAPIALDFAFPISEEQGDENEVFSFFIGWLK